MSNGIYIHGMKLPEYGVLVLKIDPKGNVCTTARNDYKKYNAVELPTHGRLGDLDALYKIAVSRTEKSQDCFNEMERVISPRDIRLTPAIIPADPPEGGADG